MPRRVLSRRTGEFILALLEQPRAAIAAAAMEDLDPDIGAELTANGSLRPVSASQSMQIADDNGILTRDLSWAPDVERYAYFDAADGWVAPDPEELKVYRLDIGWWLAWLADELALENAGKPTELVADHAWDLGDIRISRKRKAPLLFARRLYAEDVHAALMEALGRRAGRSGGVLLTTARHAVEASAIPGSHRVMAVVDSLTSHATNFHLDVALIQGLFLGRSADALGTPALDLSPDGVTLTIHGDVLHFRGNIQQSIVKQLVDAFRRDERLRTLEVLARARSSADSLAKAFKGSPNWPALRRTIHSLIYSVIEATEEEIAEAQKKIEQAEAEARRLSGFDRTTAEAAIEAMRQAIAGMKKPRFALNPQSDAAEARLIVLDEVSMVGEDMARDLMSFGKPILVLGDPGQLPPIKGEGAFTKDAPDIMLTEIHRQAAESAVIRLATLAREGQPIGFGQHDTFVWKMRKADVTPEQCLRGGQVICGMNATRLQLNNGMRRAAGFTDRGYLPTGKGEKIICLKNQNDLGLINGMFLTLDDIADEGSLYFSAIVTDEDGNPIGLPAGNGTRGRLRIYKGHFEDHLAFDKNRHDRDWKEKRHLAEATFGWAITAHKAQGSQWENVIVWDDGLGRSEQDRRRWLYTAVTRAEKGLVILA